MSKYEVKDGCIVLAGAILQTGRQESAAVQRFYRFGYQQGYIAAIEHILADTIFERLLADWGWQALQDLLDWANGGQLADWACNGSGEAPQAGDFDPPSEVEARDMPF